MKSPFLQHTITTFAPAWIDLAIPSVKEVVIRISPFFILSNSETSFKLDVISPFG